MTEFAINECHSITTEIFSFLITKDFNLCMSFDIVDLSAIITRERVLKRFKA